MKLVENTLPYIQYIYVCTDIDILIMTRYLNNLVCSDEWN